MSEIAGMLISWESQGSAGAAGVEKDERASEGGGGRQEPDEHPLRDKLHSRRPRSALQERNEAESQP